MEEAIVLGGVDYGDSDRIVQLLTRGRGRVAAFAAGARKSKRRFAGALEPFTVLEAQLSERRGDLLFLNGCTVHEGHGGLRLDLARLAHAGHAVELCRELCREREPQPELYEELRRYLGTLATSEASPADLLALELSVLGHVGLAPRFLDCTVCGGPADVNALFDPPHGGALCGACVPMAFPGAVRVGPDLLQAAAALQEAGPWGGAALADPRLRAGIRGLVRRFTHHTLGRNPRSLDFLAQLGIEG